MFGFWFFCSVAIAGYYFLEYEKVKRKKVKEVFANETKALVTKEDLPRYTGVKEEDIDDLIKKIKIKAIEINGKEYYKLEEVLEEIEEL